MKAKPIIFSAPMVCAILEGKKNQTTIAASGDWIGRAGR